MITLDNRPIACVKGSGGTIGYYNSTHTELRIDLCIETERSRVGVMRTFKADTTGALRLARQLSETQWVTIGQTDYRGLLAPLGRKLAGRLDDLLKVLEMSEPHDEQLARVLECWMR